MITQTKSGKAKRNMLKYNTKTMSVVHMNTRRKASDSASEEE